MRSQVLGFILLSLISPVAGQSAPRQPSVRNFIHDPSTIVKCQDTYWVFATGHGISSRHSTNLVDWERGPSVFTAAPDWTVQAVPGNRGHLWAPDIIHFNGRYWLYYSVSTWGSKTSAIGLATNPTLDPAAPTFAWTDHGAVIQSGPGTDFNAIDPCVTLDADGNLWLGFGSFWTGIKLVQLDPATGKRISPDSLIYSLAHQEAIEAPFIHQHGGFYYLFVNWGLCCRGTNSTYNIRVGRSASITGPYLDKQGEDLRRGGGTLLLSTSGSRIGPGHAGIIEAGGTNWLSYHYYDETKRGAATLGLKRLERDPSGWPMVK